MQTENPFLIAKAARKEIVTAVGQNVSTIVIDYLRPWRIDLTSISTLCRHDCLIFLPDDEKLAVSDNASIFLAVSLGSLPLIEWLDNNQNDKRGKGNDFAGRFSHQDLLLSATVSGHLHVLKWIRTKQKHMDITFESWLLKLAVQHGHIHIVEWIFACNSLPMKPRSIRDAMDQAAASGHLPLVKWFDDHRSEGCSNVAMDAAAANGHFDVVKWLYEHRNERCSCDAMDGAAANGHLEIVQWLHARGLRVGCTKRAMDRAAEMGYLHVVKWLHENRTEGCSKKAMDGAARNGHLHVVQWLHETRREGCSTDALDGALMYGHTKMIEWLHKHRHEGCSEWMLKKVQNGDCCQQFRHLFFPSATDLSRSS